MARGSVKRATRARFGKGLLPAQYQPFPTRLRSRVYAHFLTTTSAVTRSALCKEGLYPDVETQKCEACPPGGSFPPHTFKTPPFIALYVVIVLVVVYKIFTKVSEVYCLERYDADEDGDIDLDDAKYSFERRFPTAYKMSMYVCATSAWGCLCCT